MSTSTQSVALIKVDAHRYCIEKYNFSNQRTIVYVSQETALLLIKKIEQLIANAREDAAKKQAYADELSKKSKTAGTNYDIVVDTRDAMKMDDIYIIVDKAANEAYKVYEELYQKTYDAQQAATRAKCLANDLSEASVSFITMLNNIIANPLKTNRAVVYHTEESLSRRFNQWFGLVRATNMRF